MELEIGTIIHFSDTVWRWPHKVLGYYKVISKERVGAFRKCYYSLLKCSKTGKEYSRGFKINNDDIESYFAQEHFTVCGSSEVGVKAKVQSEESIKKGIQTKKINSAKWDAKAALKKLEHLISSDEMNEWWKEYWASKL